MKKNTLFATLLTLFAFAAVTFTACVKDVVPDCGSTCDAHGTCRSGPTCVCDEGYTGTSCETAFRDAFLGTWNVQEDSAGVTKNYTCVISAGAAGFGDKGITVASLNECTFAGQAASTTSVSLSSITGGIYLNTEAAGSLSSGVLTIIASFPERMNPGNGNMIPAFSMTFRLTK